MKNDVMKALEYAVKQLEKEWERTGSPKKIAELDKKQLQNAFYEVKVEVGFRSEVFQQADDLLFEDFIRYSHENYVLLRLGRKLYKALVKIDSKGCNFVKVMLDTEEEKIFMELMNRE